MCMCMIGRIFFLWSCSLYLELTKCLIDKILKDFYIRMVIWSHSTLFETIISSRGWDTQWYIPIKCFRNLWLGLPLTNTPVYWVFFLLPWWKTDYIVYTVFNSILDKAKRANDRMAIIDNHSESKHNSVPHLQSLYKRYPVPNSLIEKCLYPG